MQENKPEKFMLYLSVIGLFISQLFVIYDVFLTTSPSNKSSSPVFILIFQLKF